MSEENQVVNEPSPIEQEAMELGWQPKEDFDKNPNNTGKRWRSAELFLELKPLYEHTDQIKRENKKLKEAVDNTTQMFAKVKAEAYDEALKKLKAEKKVALEDQDVEKVIEIDDQIDDIKEEKRKAVTAAVVTSNDIPPSYQSFLSRNPWYSSDQQLKEYADTLGVQLRLAGTDFDEMLVKVERAVKTHFPDKFKNPNRKEASMVEGKSGSGKSESLKLSPIEQKIMEKIVSTGVMTQEEYLKSYKDSMGVK
jgi:hypothetical protein